MTEDQESTSKIIKFPNRPHHESPQARNVPQNGTRILDFQEYKERQRRMQACLEKSSLPPTGEAYKETFVNGPITYHIVALKDHYSKQAVRMTDELLTNLKPVAMIVEGCNFLKGVSEVDFAKEEAKRLGIPVLDIILNPYSAVIAEKAGVKPREALKAIILAEVDRYKENPDLLIKHLSRTFNIHRSALNLLILVLTKEIESGSVSPGMFGPIFNELIQVANDLSWYRLQKLSTTLKGDVIAIVGGMHAEIFNRQYRPRKEYSEEELNAILKRVEFHESGVEAMLSPKSVEESVLELFGQEDFFREWERLSEELKANPKNEIARQRLKNLLTKDYDDLMSKGEFSLAAQRARGLVKAGIPEGKQMLITALNNFYLQSMNNGLYINASQAAEELCQLGAEGAEALLKKAKEKLESKG